MRFSTQDLTVSGWPSHGLFQPIDVARPVVVGGMAVRPGDLLHGDTHGGVNIPVQIADKIDGRLVEIQETEDSLIQLAKSKDFTLEKYKPMFRDLLGKIVNPGTLQRSGEWQNGRRAGFKMGDENK